MTATDLDPEANVTRSVAVSTTTQLVARGFDLLVNVAVSLALVRHLGPRGYGDFVVVVTVAGLAGLLAEFGLPKLAVREVSRDPSTAGVVIGTVTVVRLVLAAVAAGIAQLVLLALDASAEVRVATLVAGLLAVSEALMSLVVVFHVSLRQQHEAVARLAANVLKLVLVLALVGADAGLVPLVAAPSATALVAVALAYRTARRRFGLRLSFDRHRIAGLLRDAAPIAPAMLVGVLYLKLDALMVGLLGTRHDVGVYGAAYQPIEYVLLASAVVIGVLFPLLARAQGRDHDRFVRVYRRGVEMLVAAMLPVAVVLSFIAVPLTKVAFEARFADSAGPMIVLGWALILIATNGWQSFTLLAAGRQRVNLAYLSGAVVANVVLDVFLVPWLGPIGAAWGTLLSAALLVVASTFAVRKLASATLAPVGLARVVGANAAPALLIGGGLTVGLAWWASAVLAYATYPLWLLLSGVVDERERRAVWPRHREIDLPALEREEAQTSFVAARAPEGVM